MSMVLLVLIFMGIVVISAVAAGIYFYLRDREK